MNDLVSKRPHILFLFSDTGGGHRSATEAIIEAIHLEFDGRVTMEMADIFKDYAPRPLNHMPEWYTYMVRVPRIWGLGFRLSNGRRRARLLNDSAWPYPSDLIVSLHPFGNAALLRALGKQRPPFITVVTDLVSTHALWYDRRVDLCLVPTEAARERALASNLPPEKVKVVGLPVADRFCQPPGDRSQLRAQLGWPQEPVTVLLVGGGEGMGPLERTAHVIAHSGLPLSLVIITGHNKSLKAQLEAQNWPLPVCIYGFVNKMPDFMGAADILVTKAGPGTISEALNAGRPMILYSRLPGQEEGNVSYVEDLGAGVWAPHPELIVQTLREWIEKPASYARAVAACRQAARPQAARHIARILADKVGLS
jgi:1,2-diacylglycerol 3-beta-galactosyltransferase